MTPAHLQAIRAMAGYTNRTASHMAEIATMVSGLAIYQPQWSSIIKGRPPYRRGRFTREHMELVVRELGYSWEDVEAIARALVDDEGKPMGGERDEES